MGERRSDTREKIQAVALELFAEHGYEKTSLREIAERLDVTKAALYYHFNTKEDIAVSLFDRLLADMDEIIAWLREQPCTLETRQALVQRYARLAGGWPPGRCGAPKARTHCDAIGPRRPTTNRRPTGPPHGNCRIPTTGRSGTGTSRTAVPVAYSVPNDARHLRGNPAHGR